MDGLWGNASRLNLLRRRLESRGVAPVTIHRYDNSGRACLEGQGRILAELVASFHRPVNLIGYSMGGLVIRSARLTNPDLSVNRVGFLNTPHAGTLTATCFAGAGFTQMRPKAAFLRNLDAQPWDVPTYVAWTPADLVVVPGISARWPRATRTHCCHTPAHIWPIFCPVIHRELADFLLDPNPNAAQRPASPLHLE